jgi:hypothetical protein
LKARIRPLLATWCRSADHVSYFEQDRVPARAFSGMINIQQNDIIKIFSIAVVVFCRRRWSPQPMG